MRRWLDWLLRSRETGRITVAQPPNLLLIGFFAAWLVGRFATTGSVARTAGIVAHGCLALWAADELLRGVNPFRRMLGAAVLAYLAVLAWSLTT